MEVENITMAYLLDEMLSGKEAVCRNLLKQNKQLIRLPSNMKGIEDRKIVLFAKRKGYGFITKDVKCAKFAKEQGVRTIHIHD